MRWLLVLVALTLPIEARGEALVGRSVEQPAPAIRIGRPEHGAKIERSTLDLWLRNERTVARLTLDVTGADTIMRDVEIPLELPPDARATGLSVTMSNTRFRASAMGVVQARAFYKETVERFTDPVLLESAGGSRYRLRVYPVNRAMPATVEIVFSIPRESALAITPVGHSIANVAVKIDGESEVPRLHSWTNVAKQHALALPSARPGIVEPLVVEGAAVNGATSLVAGGNAAQLRGRGGRVPTVMIGTPSATGCSFSRPPPIRRYVKLQHPRLRHCYMRAAQRDPSLAGTVQLQFMIHTDGHVTPAPAFGGDLKDAQVHACLRDEVAAWDFGPIDTMTQVNYPLTFRLSE